jgi:hypothetical protein
MKKQKLSSLHVAISSSSYDAIFKLFSFSFNQINFMAALYPRNGSISDHAGTVSFSHSLNKVY